MPERRICILDAGPLIHLDQLGRVGLLELLGELFVTATVAREAESHRPGVLGRLRANQVDDSLPTSSELSAAALEHRLHAGEFSALAWAEAFGADLFVTDDTLARLAAKNLGYATTGTIGVILEAEKAGVLARSDAIALLGEIHLRTTLHVRMDFLNRVIASLR